MLKDVTKIMNRIQTIQKRFGLLNQNKEHKVINSTVNNKFSDIQAQLKTQQVNVIKKRADEISRTQGVPSQLVNSIIQNSSAYNPALVSSDKRMGLMQLMPSITKNSGVKNPLSIDENLTTGISLLKKYLNKYDGDYVKALAAFNTGDKFQQKNLSSLVKNNINNVLATYKQNSLEKN